MNIEPDDFQIARGFWSSDWKKLDIHKNTKWNASWEIAVAIFERRINARFIDQIDALIENKDKATANSSGFAVVALDCLLIETLDQFYNGNHETARGKRQSILVFWRKNDDPHVAAFHAVFQRSSTLKIIFDTAAKTKVFYQHIRCGLLHQAQTKKKSKINRKIKAPIEWCDLNKPSLGLIVEPRLFHRCVKKVYSDYLNQLRNEEQGDLRKLFRRKMNRIAGM